ncbi:MAG: hypothetical protein KGJ08_09675 [Gammaproteobacteria bacterium]|nr:hypothetical protein [Gammaproteobacteria bacterium]
MFRKKKPPPPHEAILLLHHSIIRDIGKSLSSLGINLLLGFIASLMMLHLHQGAYQSFQNFMTGAISPDILLVLTPVSMILIGVEFLFLAFAPYEKGRVPRFFTSLILGVKDSIVVVSGLSMGMACATFLQNPYAAWSSFLAAMFYFVIAFFLAFICFAPFYTDLNGFKSRIAFIFVGAGFLSLAVYFPYFISQLSWLARWMYPASLP